MKIYFRDLHEQVRKLAADSTSSIEIFAPFITVTALGKVLSDVPQSVRVSVITTWRLKDVLAGVSDPRLYELCQKNKAKLYINQRIHLKTIVSDHRRLLTGSANITSRALGLSSVSNFETLVETDQPPRDYLLYLASIRTSATLVTDQIASHFQELCYQHEKLKTEADPAIRASEEEFDLYLAEDKALRISSLPMSSSIENLYEVLNGSGDFDSDVLSTAIHDIANFKLDDLVGLQQAEFEDALKTRFFHHPFIAELVNYITEPRRFGAIKQWVQETCIDDPVPSRRDLTGNVKVLYAWLVRLGDQRFEIYQPGHSELIAPRGSLQSAQSQIAAGFSGRRRRLNARSTRRRA